MTRTHELKCWPAQFDAIVNGKKAFEYRKDDRGFAVGDMLHLREWSPTAEKYLGRALHAHVTYILRGPSFGVPEGYCVMQLGSPPA